MIFVLIGGKSKDDPQTIIEEDVIKLTNKNKPKLLFIPFAATDIDKSITKFHNLVKALPLEITYLNYDNFNDFEKLINENDIIYVGGGISNHLNQFFKDNKLDIILKKYLDSDKIYVGLSAGAMMVTKIAMGDKDLYVDNFHNYGYKMVECINILNISICPHYQNEDLIIYNDEAKKIKLDSFGIEEDTALVIDNEKYYVLKDNKRASLYHIDKDGLLRPLYEGITYEKTGGFRTL